MYDALVWVSACGPASVSSIGSESSRNWYDETFCFTSSTFDYNCLATSDTNVYNYFPSLDSSSISAVFATSTQFVYFPVSQSARTWGISPPDKHRLLLQLNSSEEAMTMDVYLNFKRSFYYDDNQDSRIRTSVTLSEDQNVDYLPCFPQVKIEPPVRSHWGI